MIVVWEDFRSGPASDLYGVRVRSNGLVTEVPATASMGWAPPRAWPNPFTDQVSIAFSLTVTTSVRVEVFDVAGRRVWASPTKLLSPGRQSLAWDGRSDSGLSQGGGIYFLRVRGAGIATSRTVVRVE